MLIYRISLHARSDLSSAKESFTNCFMARSTNEIGAFSNSAQEDAPVILPKDY